MRQRQKESVNMVLATLLSNENGIIRYSYQPEKDGFSGVLAYNKDSDTSSVEKAAEKDITSSFYRTHVFRMIKENIKKLPKEILLSWY